MKYLSIHYKPKLSHRFFTLSLSALLLTSCKVAGFNALHTCYINCGDNREIVISDVKFIKVEKSLFYGKTHELNIVFSFKSNYDLQESQKEYSAVTFSLRVPMPCEAANDGNKAINAFAIDKVKLISANNYEYEGSISLAQRGVEQNNYLCALAIIRKHDGLPLEPTMARMSWGPSLVKFKPALLELNEEQINVVKPEEWDK